VVVAAAITAVLLAGGLAGCGDSTEEPASGELAPVAVAAAPEAEPVMPVVLTDDLDRDVEITSVERIIPVDGDLAEIVFALGLGDNVVATDLSATYPPEADARPEIGYQRSLLAEPILSFSPTVVLATDAAGPKEVVDQLSTLVPTVYVVAPDDLGGPAAKIRAVAKALGVPGRGEELARKTQGEIDAAVAAVPADRDELRVAALYLRGDRVQQIFGPGSGMHALLDAIGVVDIGELLGVDDNQPVTTESILREQPDVLITTTTGLESVGGVHGLLGQPAFERTPVAESRRVFAYETQYLFGFGPRTGQLLRELTTDLYQNN
jgi:iron complex transport system substrate-binding protein